MITKEKTREKEAARMDGGPAYSIDADDIRMQKPVLSFPGIRQRI